MALSYYGWRRDQSFAAQFQAAERVDKVPRLGRIKFQLAHDNQVSFAQPFRDRRAHCALAHLLRQVVRQDYELPVLF